MSKVNEKYNYKDTISTQNYLEIVQLRFANKTGIFLTTSQLFILMRIFFYTIFELTLEKSVQLKFIGTFSRFKSKWIHPKTHKPVRETIKFKLGDRPKKIIAGIHEEFCKNEFFKNEVLKPLEYFIEKKKLDHEKKISNKRLEKFKIEKEEIIKQTKKLDQLYSNVSIDEVKKEVLTKKRINKKDNIDLSDI